MAEIKQSSAEILTENVVNGIQEKKGTKIVILDMREIEGCICQFFVICEGESTTQVAAIADSVEEYVQENLNEKPISTEGKAQAEWVLVDYADVVVHVFQHSARDFYRLEDLWADAKRRDIEDLF